jgi:hypothetical protein
LLVQERDCLVWRLCCLKMRQMNPCCEASRRGMSPNSSRQPPSYRYYGQALNSLCQYFERAMIPVNWANSIRASQMAARRQSCLIDLSRSTRFQTNLANYRQINHPVD